ALPISASTKASAARVLRTRLLARWPNARARRACSASAGGGSMIGCAWRDDERGRAMVLLPPRLRRRHPLHGDHHGARSPARRPQHRVGVEVYAGSPAGPGGVVRALPRPLGREPPRGGDQAAVAGGEAGADAWRAPA